MLGSCPLMSSGALLRVGYGLFQIGLHWCSTQARSAAQVHYGVLPCLEVTWENSDVLLQGRVDSLLSRTAQAASVQLEVDLQTWRT